jgi:hypothetical protein
VQLLQKRTRTGLDTSTCYVPEIGSARNMGMGFFEIWDGTQSRWALGVAAGWETVQSSLDYQRPMLSFYDVTNSQTVAACAANLPQDPLILYGTPYPNRPGGFMFGFDTGIVGDRTFLFGADLAGQVLVFDVSDLFGTGGVEVTSWQSGPNLYDGLPDGVPQLKFVADTDADPDFKGWIYASASRLGLVRLRFYVDSLGTATLELDEIINTPGQAAGFQIRDVGGDIRLILSDHEDFGLRAYGDF